MPRDAMGGGSSFGRTSAVPMSQVVNMTVPATPAMTPIQRTSGRGTFDASNVGRSLSSVSMKLRSGKATPSERSLPGGTDIGRRELGGIDTGMARRELGGGGIARRELEGGGTGI